MSQILRFFLLSATCLLVTAASAHWEWIDKDGVKVFSDRAPPAEILEKNILKRPSIVPVTVATSPASVAAASSPTPSGVDKGLLEKKKQAEEFETAQRKARDEKIRLGKIDNCLRAKQAKANYESGVRLSRTTEKGELEVLDDAARSLELKRVQTIIDSECV